MIGPGTGVAPFIGFLGDRTTQVMQLYFGCKREGDYIYRDAIEAAGASGVEINVAYSQKDKKYVQDLIKDNK
jgi:sulfite reductase alpha subunit-like flavoprotein